MKYQSELRKKRNFNPDVMLRKQDRKAGIDGTILIARSDLYFAAERELRLFLRKCIRNVSPREFFWVHTKDEQDLPITPTRYKGIVNFQRINDIQRLDNWLKNVNYRLLNGMVHVVHVETKQQRKKRILAKYPPVIRSLHYSMDFVFKRFFPKWGPTRRLYHKINKGRNRVMSLAETMGRLSAAGFAIVDHMSFGGKTWIVTCKKGAPSGKKVSMGAICRLKRIGLGRKAFNVYKLRTMHPYSEFIQDFVMEQNKLRENGKVENDYRITRWGGWMRRFWIDELPMLVNWLKGEMKLVGVRPLSRSYFDLYPKELQDLRIRVKPGLVPPYYADMPQTQQEIYQSEKNYIKSYLKNPVRTDVTYFSKAIWNIIFRGARSS